MNLIETIAHETIEQLLAAGYPADTTDNGWAFDRATHVLNCKEELDSWSDDQMDRCQLLISELACNYQ